jgi:hypothetical protein
MFMIKKTASLLILISLLIGITNCGQTTEPTTPSPNQEPVEVVSVSVVAIAPGGQTVKITLKNAGEAPVIDVSATLELGKGFYFGFMSVSDLHPLLPGKSVSDTLNLYSPEGALGSGLCSLKIAGKLQDGTQFAYTKQAKVTEYHIT